MLDLYTLLEMKRIITKAEMRNPYAEDGFLEVSRWVENELAKAKQFLLKGDDREA